MTAPFDESWAHVRVAPAGERHLLQDHLTEVARLAAGHATGFGGQEWARLAGLWHDLGKYRSGFQRYLRAASGAEAESAHIENLDPAFEGMPILRQRHDGELTTVMSNSFGFGGTNGTLILSKV